MMWRYPGVCALLSLVTVLVPARVNASDDGPSPDPPGRFSVAVAAGSHWNDGGNLQAFSFGFAPSPAVTLVVNVERNHIPTKVQSYPNGYSATRGTTLVPISAELRYTVAHTRVAPFVFAGGGAGTSRPNVNDIFPDPVTNVARVAYAGGGVLFPLGRALALSVDARFLLLTERGEAAAMVPLRAGIVWRF